MTVILLNTETCEVRQWDYERPVTRRTLKTRIARYIAWDADDDKNHFLLLPSQELVPGEILDMLRALKSPSLSERLDFFSALGYWICWKLRVVLSR